MRTISIDTIGSLFDRHLFKKWRVKFKSIGEAATELRRMVNEYSGDLALKEFALKIIRDAGVPSRDEYDQAIGIAEWAQNNIYYVHESVETFQTPFTTLRLKAGDCDDFTVLIASMLGTVGIPNKLALMNLNSRWAHIFPIGIFRLDDGKRHRVPLDATLPSDHYDVRDVPSPVKIAQDRGDRVRLMLV